MAFVDSLSASYNAAAAPAAAEPAMPANIVSVNGCFNGYKEEFTMFLGLNFDSAEKEQAFGKRADQENIQNDLTNFVRAAGRDVFASDPGNPENFSDETKKLLTDSVLPDAMKSINDKYNIGLVGAQIMKQDVFDDCQAEDIPAAKQPAASVQTQPISGPSAPAR